MKSLLVALTVLAAPAWAYTREPDELFVRHARDLVPQFLEAQSRLFGTPLTLDLDSVHVQHDILASPIFTSLLPLEYSAAMLMFPIQATDRCRRVDGVIRERGVRAAFFVRDRGTHFELSRSCIVEETRSPLLVLEEVGHRFHRFSDAEIVEVVRPLVTSLVRSQAAGAAVTPESFSVRAPWYETRVEMSDQRGILDGQTPRDCRNLSFEMPVTHQRGTVAVSITYDTDDLLPKVPLEYQTIHDAPSLLRRFRFALVRGCTYWNREAAPKLEFKRLK